LERKIVKEEKTNFRKWTNNENNKEEKEKKNWKKNKHVHDDD